MLNVQNSKKSKNKIYMSVDSLALLPLFSLASLVFLFRSSYTEI